MISKSDIGTYLSGYKLIGDDYSEAEILQWYEEEKDAYAGLVDARKSYYYEYHALNAICGFNILKNTPPFSIRACGFGSAFGDELLPIQDKIASTILIDSASSFHSRPLPQGVQTILAQPSGEINSSADSFDLITCFGVLHHIPNVSFVVKEFHRCLASGGLLMVREPTTSMGDWRRPRYGVTKNERGIPSSIFKGILMNAGFEIIKHNQCVFPPLAFFVRKFGLSPFNSKILVYLDLLLSRFFNWNYRYHRVKLLDKFSPASDFFVCRKL
jgi:SAM-dependent methyltransferase